MYTFFGCCVFDNVWVLVGVWTAGKSLPRIYFSSGNMSKCQFTLTTYILMARISNSSLVVCGNHRHTVDIVDIYAPYWYVVNLHLQFIIIGMLNVVFFFLVSTIGWPSSWNILYPARSYLKPIQPQTVWTAWLMLWRVNVYMIWSFFICYFMYFRMINFVAKRSASWAQMCGIVALMYSGE